MVLLGRLPSNVRCGTWAAGTPSAATSAAVLPKASASVWAMRLAVRRSWWGPRRSEEHTSELQSHLNLVCRLLLEKKKRTPAMHIHANNQRIVLLLNMSHTPWDS